MNRKTTTLVILTAAAFAAFLADSAFARQNHGGRSRARSVVLADTTSPAAGAQLAIRIRSQSNGRWEFRMQLEHAPAGIAPEAWVADATGTLVLVGSLTADNSTSGEYRLRLRGGASDTLPVDATVIGDLQGRAFEIRDAGVAILSGTLPSQPAAADSSASSSSTTGGTDDSATSGTTDDNGAGASGTGGTDDPATHDATDDNGGAAASTSGAAATSNSGHGGHGHGGNDGSGHH